MTQDPRRQLFDVVRSHKIASAAGSKSPRGNQHVDACARAWSDRDGTPCSRRGNDRHDVVENLVFNNDLFDSILNTNHLLSRKHRFQPKVLQVSRVSAARVVPEDVNFFRHGRVVDNQFKT